MIAWLTGLGLSRRAAGLALYVAAALLIFAAFYLSLNAYGHARYRAGVRDTDAAWQAASAKLTQKAASAADKADKKQAAAAQGFAVKQAAEERKIQDAKQAGASPFDVLFGNAG